MRLRFLLAAIALSTLSLSGCLEDEVVAPEVTDPDGVTTTLAGELTVDSVVEAPKWQVGQYFGHHVFFGPTDASGMHINTVVYDETPTDYLLGTDNEEVAEIHAMFDVPILGSLSKKDLSTTSFGGPWGGFNFPLSDGKTWDSQITAEQDQLGGPITRDVTVTSIFNPAIEMPGSTKTQPGFDITGRMGEDVLFATNYVPLIGWYATFQYFDLTTEDPDDYMMQVRSMGYGTDFGRDLGGVLHIITATKHVDHLAVSVVPAADVEPFYSEAFTISPEGTKIMGIIFAFAAAGHSEVDFLDPDGTLHRWEEATDVPTNPDPNQWQGSGGGDLYTLPLIAGEWTYTQTNAGFVAGGGAQIWELFAEQIIL